MGSQYQRFFQATGPPAPHTRLVHVFLDPVSVQERFERVRGIASNRTHDTMRLTAAPWPRQDLKTTPRIKYRGTSASDSIGPVVSQPDQRRGNVDVDLGSEEDALRDPGLDSRGWAGRHRRRWPRGRRCAGGRGGLHCGSHTPDRRHPGHGILPRAPQLVLGRGGVRLPVGGHLGPCLRRRRSGADCAAQPDSLHRPGLHDVPQGHDHVPVAGLTVGGRLEGRRQVV